MTAPARATAYRVKPQRPLFFQQLAPTGMRDSLDPSAGHDRKFALIQNLYPQDPEIGGGLWGRPGFQQAGAQLGAGSTRKGQGVYQFTKLAGTEYTVGICGGKFYTFNWSTRAWTEAISAATLAAAVVTLSTSAKCYFATIADQLVVSDGVNTPWMWDGATVTKLTNCPVLYGQPVVHYAKLFGIKNASRSTIVWSEENDPATGYEAGGYDNAWQLGQTDQEALYRLVAINAGLYFFRARSIGLILGAVEEDFRTAGVRDEVSATIGTMSPDAVVLVEDRIFFADADAHPQVLVPGLGVQSDSPIWEDARETCRHLPRAGLAEWVAIPWTPGSLVWFGVSVTAGAGVGKVLHFDAIRGEFTGVFTGFEFTAAGLVKDGNGVPTVLHLTSDGYAYDHGHPQGSLWSDGHAAGTEAIAHKVIGGYSGYDTHFVKHFATIDFSLRMTAALTGLKVSYATPEAAAAEQTAALDGGFALFDVSLFDVDRFQGEMLERHLSIGIDGTGRYCQVHLRHSAVGEQFGIIGWTIEAFPVGKVASTP